MLNYTNHELNRTVLIKKGQDLQSYRWLNSKEPLQKRGLRTRLCDVGVTGQALQGSRALFFGAQVCTFMAHPQLNASSAE